MKQLYAVLAGLGIVLPFALLFPWVMENGFDLPALFREAVSTRIGAFAWLDVVLSALALIVFILHEGQRTGMDRLWLPILGTCLVGVSCGLPLFLWMRELHKEEQFHV